MRPVVLLLFCVACSGYRTPRDSEPIRREIGDRNIATRVRVVLGEDPETAPYDTITVSCDRGRVTLEGTVDRPSVKRRAVELAQGCAGVRDVKDRIIVRAAPGGR